MIALLSINLTVNSTELNLDERFKAAELIEATNPYQALPLYQKMVEEDYAEAKVRLAALLSSGLSGKGTKEENI